MLRWPTGTKSQSNKKICENAAECSTWAKVSYWLLLPTHPSWPLCHHRSKKYLWLFLFVPLTTCAACYGGCVGEKVSCSMNIRRAWLEQAKVPPSSVEFLYVIVAHQSFGTMQDKDTGDLYPVAMPLDRSYLSDPRLFFVCSPAFVNMHLESCTWKSWVWAIRECYCRQSLSLLVDC